MLFVCFKERTYSHTLQFVCSKEHDIVTGRVICRLQKHNMAIEQVLGLLNIDDIRRSYCSFILKNKT